LARMGSQRKTEKGCSVRTLIVDGKKGDAFNAPLRTLEIGLSSGSKKHWFQIEGHSDYIYLDNDEAVKVVNTLLANLKTGLQLKQEETVIVTKEWVINNA
jgi:hypothetical protein